ncbi:MAG TPA: phosphoribosyltransferase family protein [Chloroflexia bacterium]|nr:phosphoribosyltransferase family protein [Chloroflexia bacterium]
MESNTGKARFNDREHAGYELALDLKRFLGGQTPVVLAIPPEGVPVAASVAAGLVAPLDVVVSQRIPSPVKSVETLGAVTPDRTLVINRPLVSRLNLSDDEIEHLAVPAWAEAQKMLGRYRSGRPYPDLRGRTAVLVGDGLTSGYTMMAAVVATRKLEPAKIMVAVPVGAIEAIERVGAAVDDLLSLEIKTDPDFSVESHYVRYVPFTDEEVVWTLEQFWRERPPLGNSETF